MKKYSFLSIGLAMRMNALHLKAKIQSVGDKQFITGNNKIKNKEMKAQINGFYILIALLVLMIGCKKSDKLARDVCENTGKVVYMVSREVGRIMYHEDTQTYYLSYHVPKTIDVVLNGIVCNMPSVFPKQGEYLEVIFSGVFKEMENDSGILGWDKYYLELSTIQLSEKNDSQ